MANKPERRRGAELEHALLTAALEELVDNGYAAFTIDAVAHRAGTSRTVLYRRWPDKHALVRAAVAHLLARMAVIPVPDTGSLREDLLTALREINRTRFGLAALMIVHLGGYYQETGTGPAELRDAAAAGRPGLIDAILAHAVERGELDPARLTARIAALPVDLLRQEFLMTLRPVAEETIEEIVDTIFLPLVRVSGEQHRDTTEADLRNVGGGRGPRRRAGSPRRS